MSLGDSQNLRLETAVWGYLLRIIVVHNSYPTQGHKVGPSLHAFDGVMRLIGSSDHGQQCIFTIKLGKGRDSRSILTGWVVDHFETIP